MSVINIKSEFTPYLSTLIAGVNSDENIRKAFSKENSDKGLMMSLSDTFFFESGVARISEEAIPILEVEILLASKNKN